MIKDLSKPPRLFIYFLIPVCVFLGFNKHGRDTQNHHRVIWADAAGYYVYLPIWFIHGNNPSGFPQNIEKETGDGFQFNEQKEKVITKYPCGVAILQTPFFLASHVLAYSFSHKKTGFSLIYHWGIIIAASVYACLGLFFLFSFLSQFFKPKIAFFTCLLLLTATNLYYYAIDASGMSHVYSFFVFSALLYTGFKLFRTEKLLLGIVFGLLCGLAVLIRPTNLLFIVFIMLMSWNDLGANKGSLIKKLLNKPSLIVVLLFAGLVTLIPQMFYWKDVSGSLVHYSYTNEGFTNWLNPKLAQIWFSPNNGLFIYSPILLLSVIGTILMIAKRKHIGILIGVFFLVISYVFASWWCWWYGCSLGSRSFIEYYTLLAIPMAWLFSNLKTKNQIITITIAALVCVWLNFDITYYYDGCFYGSEWDFKSYFYLLKD